MRRSVVQCLRRHRHLCLIHPLQRSAQFSQRPILKLAHAFPSDLKLFANFIQRLLFAAIQSVASGQYFGFARRELLYDLAQEPAQRFFFEPFPW